MPHSAPGVPAVGQSVGERLGVQPERIRVADQVGVGQTSAVPEKEVVVRPEGPLPFRLDGTTVVLTENDILGGWRFFR